MAVSLDIARTYISEVENGKRELGVITLAALTLAAAPLNEAM
jgi:transcriptional regulator with XRE-family HTH domain